MQKGCDDRLAYIIPKTGKQVNTLQKRKWAAAIEPAALQKENAMEIQYRHLYKEEIINGNIYPVSYLQRAPMSRLTSSMPESFEIVADGENLNGSFVFLETRAETDGTGIQSTVVSLKSTRVPLRVDIITETVAESEPDEGYTMSRKIRVLNESEEKPVRLTALTMFQGICMQKRGMAPDSETFRLGYMHEGAPGREGDFHWENLTLGTTKEVKNATYTERYRLPFAAVQDLKNGDCALLNLAFSGGYRMRFEHSGGAVYGESSLSWAVGFAGKAPVRVLAPGEEAVTPRVLITYVHGTFDEAVQSQTDYARRLAKPWPKTLAVEVSAMTNREDEAQYNLKTGKEMGADIVYIDAGWYIPKGKSLDDWPAFCGDWGRVVDTYDTSLADMREMAHRNGNRFGLWMDVEKIGFQTETFKSGRVKYLIGYDGTPVKDGPAAYMADLNDSETYEWVKKQVRYVLDTYQLDYYRLDSGVYATEAVHEYCGLMENAAWRYYDNLYRLFRELREEYPQVTFQNCAGGGMRADLGMTTIMSNTWISDANFAPDSFRIINGMTMIIPVEYCVKLINAMGAESGCTDNYKLNVARFGSPLVPASEEMLKPEFRKRVFPMLEMYRKHIRPMLPKCKVYHHTPEVNLHEENELGVLEIADPDGKCAMVCAFTLGPVEEPSFRLTFRGVRENGNYTLYANDQRIGEFTGKALGAGVPAEIPEMNDSLCLIAVEE